MLERMDCKAQAERSEKQPAPRRDQRHVAGALYRLRESAGRTCPDRTTQERFDLEDKRCLSERPACSTMPVVADHAEHGAQRAAPIHRVQGDTILSNLHSSLRNLRVIFGAMGHSMLATALVLSMDVPILRAADLSRNYTWNKRHGRRRRDGGAVCSISPAARRGLLQGRLLVDLPSRRGRHRLKKLNAWGSLPAGIRSWGPAGPNLPARPTTRNRTYSRTTRTCSIPTTKAIRGNRAPFRRLSNS